MTSMWHIQGERLIRVPKAALEREDRLETWLERDPAALGLDVLVIGRQVKTDFGGVIDLLCLTSAGDLLVAELKRDRTPREIVAQVLDYGSWVVDLSTRDIHLIAEKYLQRPLADAFKERFGTAISENLNGAHNLLIVASALDDSSRRIVEYLAKTYGVNINTAFFNFYRVDGQELLTADWLMDQQEVAERSDAKRKAPWSGYWFLNVGHGDHRSWEDGRRFGFVAAGGDRWYSSALNRLTVGDKFFAYQKKAGYVGYGEVISTAVPAKDFRVNGAPLHELELERKDILHDADDADLAEYVVGVRWLVDLPLDQAKWETGLFANQNIVCKLSDAKTLDFLQRTFGITADSAQTQTV